MRIILFRLLFLISAMAIILAFNVLNYFQVPKHIAETASASTEESFYTDESNVASREKHLKITRYDIENSMQDNMLFPPPEAEQLTYINVFYDFEPMAPLGWTNVDNTANIDTFFHVDDFADLEGYGALEGTKSMWCGAVLRPDSFYQYPPPNFAYLCSWKGGAGYGNSWLQALYSEPVEFVGELTLSYRIKTDFKGPGDRFRVQYYDSAMTYWSTIAVYESDIPFEGDESFSFVPPQNEVIIRFLFKSDDIFSDEDGLFDSYGAVIIDSISVSDDEGLIDYEDFESTPVGKTYAYQGIWYALMYEGYGKHAILKTNLKDFDPVHRNISSQWTFTYNSLCYNVAYNDYCTPSCRLVSVGCICQDEMVVSPAIDLTKHSIPPGSEQDWDIPIEDLPLLNKIELSFDVYMHTDNSQQFSHVYYFWWVRILDENDCPGLWLHTDEVYYSVLPTYINQREDISELLYNEDFNLYDDKIQVALGVADLMYERTGNCDSVPHTPAPYFDNVKVQVVEVQDPQWEYNDVELFQDNFPSNPLNVESFIRADMAKDVNPGGSSIIPGDSIVVSCASKYGGGLDTISGEPAVFMHVRCKYVGSPDAPKPPLAGPSIVGNYGTYHSVDGDWTIIQGEVARPDSLNPSRNIFMFDLNDSFLTRGYRIDYFFKAYNRDGDSTTLPERAEQSDPFFRYYFEFNCLPLNSDGWLYIYAPVEPPGSGRYFEVVLSDLFERSLNQEHDKFRIMGSTSCASNGLASRAELAHLVNSYELLIWDSGDLAFGNISDGTGVCGKSPDIQLLLDWLDAGGYLWIIGDNMASWLSGLVSPDAEELLTRCGVELIDSSFFEISGGHFQGGEPNATLSTEYSIEFHWDEYFNFQIASDESTLRTFDVLGTINTGIMTISYPEQNEVRYAAAICNTGLSGPEIYKTAWYAFDWETIRDVELLDPMARNRISYETFLYFEELPDHMTGSEDDQPYIYYLAQNYPNPFNPSTEINFSMARRGKVSIRIYNVAGQLVRTLVDDNMEAGIHSVRWEGNNNAGRMVSSGIYFYRMEAGETEFIKKMILLR